MPARAKKPCRKHGCNTLVIAGYCDKHQPEVNRERESRRGTAHQRGYGNSWKKARLGFLARNPLCVDCLRMGVITPASDVDHITPHRGDRDLFWDVNNWQPLCHSHHSQKTASGK